MPTNRGDGHAITSPPASYLPLPSTPPELDLRGLTVDEALLLIDQRLDEAARAGVRELRIIHGKGTGTLRRAVREMLSKHALVQGHAVAEPRAGGDGVTVVEWLADVRSLAWTSLVSPKKRWAAPQPARPLDVVARPQVPRDRPPRNDCRRCYHSRL